MPAPGRRINIRRVAAGLPCYFRVKASLASIPSTPGKPAARSAVAAGLSAPFSHGNFAWIPRVTGSPSTPPKSSGQYPFGTTSAGEPLQAIAFSQRRFGVVRRHGARGAGIGRIGEGDEHRDQRALHRHDAGLPAHLVERHPLAARPRYRRGAPHNSRPSSTRFLSTCASSATRFLPPPRSTKTASPDGAGLAAAAVAAVGMDRDHARCRFAALRGLDLDRQAIFVGGTVDPDLVADDQRRQQRNRAEPFENHLDPRRARHTGFIHRLAQRARQRQTGARSPLDPGRILAKDCAERYSARRNQRDRSG